MESQPKFYLNKDDKIRVVSEPDIFINTNAKPAFIYLVNCGGRAFNKPKMVHRYNRQTNGYH